MKKKLIPKHKKGKVITEKSVDFTHNVEPSYSQKAATYNSENWTKIQQQINNDKNLFVKNKPTSYTNRFDYRNSKFADWERQVDDNLKMLSNAGYTNAVEYLYYIHQNYGQHAFNDALNLFVAKLQQQQSDKNTTHDVIKAIHKGRGQAAKALLPVVAAPAIAQIPIFSIFDKFNVGLPFYKKLAADTAIGTLGYTATNDFNKAVTGKTFDEALSNTLQSAGVQQPIADAVSPFANPGGLLTFGASRYLGNTAKHVLNKFGQTITSPMRNYKAARIISNHLNTSIPSVSKVSHSPVISPYIPKYTPENELWSLGQQLKKRADFEAIKHDAAIASKLSVMERRGIPKHIRNMASNKKQTMQSSKLIDELIQPFDKLPRSTHTYSGFKEWISSEKPLEDWKPIRLSSQDPLLDYQPLPETYHKVIKNLPNSSSSYSDNYITAYRNYLNSIGYDHTSLTNDDIQKILAASNNMLTQGQTGLLKGKHLFHGTRTNPFDQFNWKETGKNTINPGYSGPGIYFSNYGTPYGNNIQPYLITNIDKALPRYFRFDYKYTPTPFELKGKLGERNIQKILRKELPENDPLYGIYQKRMNEIQQAINATKEGNTIYYGVDDKTSDYFINSSQRLEFSLPRNTGIKSLFPHPDAFRLNPETNQYELIRSWNDHRLNYKTGGKIT